MDADTQTSGGIGDVAAPQTDVDNTSLLDTEVDTGGGTGTLEGDADTAGQQIDQNAVNAARRRKEEIQRLKAELSRRDNWVKLNFGAQGITTWEQYEQAVAQSNRQQREQQQREMEAYHRQKEKELQDAGYDTAQIREFFRTDPVFIQMHQENAALKQELASSKQERQQERIAQQILSDHAALKSKYGDLVPDLKSLDEKTLELFQQGMPLKMAWKEANEDKILEWAKTRATQKTLRDVNSKAHLGTEKSGSGDMADMVEISPEKMRIYRGLGYTEKQARQKEAKYLKMQKAAKK